MSQQKRYGTEQNEMHRKKCKNRTSFIVYFEFAVFFFQHCLSIYFDFPLLLTIQCHRTERFQRERKRHWPMTLHLFLTRSIAFPRLYHTEMDFVCSTFFFFHFAIRSLFERNIGFQALSHIQLKLSTEPNRPALWYRYVLFFFCCDSMQTINIKEKSDTMSMSYDSNSYPPHRILPVPCLPVAVGSFVVYI